MDIPFRKQRRDVGSASVCADPWCSTENAEGGYWHDDRIANTNDALSAARAAIWISYLQAAHSPQIAKRSSRDLEVNVCAGIGTNGNIEGRVSRNRPVFSDQLASWSERQPSQGWSL